MVSKKELRKQILKIRDVLSLEEREQKSARITTQIFECKEYQNANKLLLFASYKSEVDTTGIFLKALEHSKDIYYPKVFEEQMGFYQVQKQEDLEDGYRGIYEPKENEDKCFLPKAEDKVLVLMPGAVFDDVGNRVGYGGGYYDKYLQQLESIMPKENVTKIAVAFECQIVEKGLIENECHDVRLDYVVTEERVIKCN